MPLFAGGMKLILATILAYVAHAVTHGDEAFARVKDGKFYVFCSGDAAQNILPSVDIVDPKTMSVTQSISMPSGTGWGDSVYMEHCDGSGAQVVLSNDRGNNKVLVMDAATKTLTHQVAMSDRPVHGYAIPPMNEFWTHADGDGVFDVLHMDMHGGLHIEDIKAHASTPGHGKLLWHEDLLARDPPVAYASNVAEAMVFEINLLTYRVSRTFNFTDKQSGDPLYCPGTHGLAYSTVNKHVYATCSNVGLIELDSRDFTIIKKHSSQTGGQVYASEDGSYIVTIDKSNNKVHILKPNIAGAASSEKYTSSIDGTPTGETAGKPDKVAFYKKTDGSERMFFSMTTPNNDANNGDAADSGLGWIDSSELDANPSGTHSLSILKGGSIKQCSYPNCHNYRSIYPGGEYVATINIYPTAGLFVAESVPIAAAAHTTHTHDHSASDAPVFKGIVPTASNPSRVIWVPDSFTGLACSTNHQLDSVRSSMETLTTSVNSLSAKFGHEDYASEDDLKATTAVAALAFVLCVVSMMVSMYLYCKLKSVLQNKGASPVNMAVNV